MSLRCAVVGAAVFLQAGAQNLRGELSHRTKCPDECMWPQCKSGFAPFAGYEKLHNGKCYQRCSAKQANGKRYCGSGDKFSTRGSVDCTGCANVPKIADFAISTPHGSITGKFEIEKSFHTVDWKVDELKIDSGLIERHCGKLVKGKPTFNYHLHEFWKFSADQLSSVGDCDLEKVGNHWDPTAACGPASGNPVCGEQFCDTQGKNYTCNAHQFDPFSTAQYRLLSPSALFPDAVTCEFGDFSGMAGPIHGEEHHHHEFVKTKVHRGKASMSATFGEITPLTLEKKPCYFGSLAKAAPPAKTYKLASDEYPLDQLPEDASVLVHCGNNYEHANKRFFCARLQ